MIINVTFGLKIFLKGILLVTLMLLNRFSKVKQEVSRYEDLYFITRGFYI